MKILSLAIKVVDSYNFTSNVSGTQSLKIPSSLSEGANDNIARVLCDAAFRPLIGMQVMGLLFGLVKISFLQVQWAVQRSHTQKKPMQGLFSQLCILPEDRDSR